MPSPGTRTAHHDHPLPAIAGWGQILATDRKMAARPAMAAGAGLFQDAFRSFARHQLEQGTAALSIARSYPQHHRYLLHEISDIAHGLGNDSEKHQYFLAGRINASLIRLVETPALAGSRFWHLVEAHLSALEIVFRHRKTGAGPAVGRELAGRLERKVDALPSRAPLSA